MRVIGVIPARYASTRFPGKPMARILQKPMIEWVYQGALKSQRLTEVIVATDHPEIQSCVESFGGKVVMTDPELPSGSDRVWQAIQNDDADIVVNIQGDEPLIDGGVLDQLIGAFDRDPEAQMATLASSFEQSEDIMSPHIVKVITNKKHQAIYFSRFAIPYSKQEVSLEANLCKRHIGLYAYKKSFLKTFCETSPVGLEQAESLEQLRAMYLGAAIHVVEVKHKSYGVDTPEDIKRVEQVLLQRENQ